MNIDYLSPEHKQCAAKMTKDDTRIFTIRLRVMMLSRTFRGGCRITSRSTGSTPKLGIKNNVNSYSDISNVQMLLY